MTTRSRLLLFLVLVGVRAGLPGADGVAGARHEIERLRAEIARHDDLYHRQSVAEISDADYDRLRRTLGELERRFPVAARAAPPLAAIGDDRTGRFAARRHDPPMLSLDKAHAPDDVRAFHARLAKALGRDEVEYVVEPKVDGLAVSLIYEDGVLVRAVTRGNGLEGEDITANVAVIPGVPGRLRPSGAEGEWPVRLDVRGEIYVPPAEFARVNAEREAAGETPFASARALAAGTVRQRDREESVRRGLRLACFGLGSCEPERLAPATQRELPAALESWGLPGLAAIGPVRGLEAVMDAIARLRRTAPMSGLPTDGAVVKLNPLAGQRALGASEAAPRWAVAYKYEPERVETRIRAITWQVGRTGVLTPVAELEPVSLAGSRVARATLHNRDEIVRQDLRVGDVVQLEKAGDVIPAIVGVNLARRSAESRSYVFPTVCPECFAPLTQVPERVAVRCSGRDCPGQLRRRIEHYASDRAVDIAGLGPAMIEILVGHGWVRDVPDLYRLRRSDLLRLGRENERSVDQLLAAIGRSRHAELWRVIHGLSIPQVGVAKAKELARYSGSLAGLAERGPEVVAVLAEPRYQDLIADLIAVGVEARAGPVPHGPLAGKTLVLTGTLPNLDRAQATARIEAAGGRVSGSVSRFTHYVVAGASPGAKLERARALAIPVLDEAGLLRLIESR